MHARTCQASYLARTFLHHSQPLDLTAFGDALAHSYIPNSAIVDCTASDAPAAAYLPWMQKGIHIITPNKKLGSGPMDQYQVRGVWWWCGGVYTRLALLQLLAHGNQCIRTSITASINRLCNTYPATEWA